MIFDTNLHQFHLDCGQISVSKFLEMLSRATTQMHQFTDTRTSSGCQMSFTKYKLFGQWACVCSFEIVLPDEFTYETER